MKIKNLAFNLLLLASLTFCLNRKEDNPATQVKFSPQKEQEIFTLETVCNQFDTLNTLVRDGLIDKNEALLKVKELASQIRLLLQRETKGLQNVKAWYFPLKGYEKDAIGGKNGSGYVFGGYDYFDGNKHTGHPAHDIFIYDKNQDCIDDNTSKPVNVISVTDGVVVALSDSWDTSSQLRGGKYVWAFAPECNSLIYYAHNDNVKVSVGEKIRAGQIIATVGRTGLNAYKKRSPTHLHFMQLQFDEGGYPKPVNPYLDLLKAKRTEN